MDLTPRTDAIGREDLSWLGSARGSSSAQSIALLVGAFTASVHYPNGYFPSGLALTKIPSGTNAGLYAPAGSRTVADGATTSGSTTLTSATAAFGSGDVGATVTGTGIPAGTTIASVTNATTAVMSANATATATGVSVTVATGSHDGNLLTAVAAPRNTAATVVNGALLDTGRIITAKLPVALPAALRTNPRFVYV